MLQEHDPFEILTDWLQEVAALGLAEPMAMSLATVDSSGRPSSRIVLLRGMEPPKLMFYTNYDSQKGHELGENSSAALNFYWDGLGKQVRITGEVSRLPDAASDAYWDQRHRDSQISQWVSKQSKPVESREQMLEEYAKAEKEFADKKVPRPPNWGGYALEADFFEFWIKREARFHDRFTYQLVESRWQTRRLYP